MYPPENAVLVFAVSFRFRRVNETTNSGLDIFAGTSVRTLIVPAHDACLHAEGRLKAAIEAFDKKLKKSDTEPANVLNRIEP